MLTRLLQDYAPVEKANKFFKPGRVFGAVWVEPAGPSSQDDANSNITNINHDQRVFAKACRFISVRNHNGFCVALRINTFGGRGQSKFHKRPAHLFFVHSADETQDIASALGPNALPVKVEDPDITFAAGKSVVLASKPYSIEHFLPVRNLGYVVKTSLGKLESALLESLGKPSSLQSSIATTKNAAIWPTPESKPTTQLEDFAESSSSQSRRDTTATQQPMPTSRSLSSHEEVSKQVEAYKDTGVPEGYYCDYNCPKQGQPFKRVEHLRDHYRDFHLEDIPRNRKFGNESKRIDWYNTRLINVDWWRCKPCMEKAYNSSYGWKCPSCGNHCEHDRVNHRVQHYPGHYDADGFPKALQKP